MSDAPLCKDCRWKKQLLLTRQDVMANCANPAVTHPSYVNGRPPGEMCVIARMERGRCGPAGKLFEPKIPRPWWRFW